MTADVIADNFEALLELRATDQSNGYVRYRADGIEERMSFADLSSRAFQISDMLTTELNAASTLELGSGAVIIPTADPLLFIASFFGTLLAGLSPIPVPSPASHPRHAARVQAIAAAAARDGSVTGLCFKGHEAGLAAALGPEPARILTLDGLMSSDREAIGSSQAFPPAEPSNTRRWCDREPHYVQYTSGSTSEPKPIKVSSAAAIAQLKLSAEAYAESQASVSVNWVPLHHDMGLVTSVLRPLYSGYNSVIIDPREFAADPSIWLSAMTHWRATHTSAPDFGYSLCTRKAQASDAYDLSTVRIARVAGELVRLSTLTNFVKRFGPVGFRSTSFAPSYGLAEATLTVTTCAMGDEPRALWLSRSALGGGTARECDPGSSDAVSVVSCGEPYPETVVRILDADGAVLQDDGRVGEVWISGPQVILDERPHFVVGNAGKRTGDLGFLRNGELYLMGRSHERFQINGENFYTNDIEFEVSRAVPYVRPGRILVYRENDRAGVGVLAEWRAAGAPPTDDLMSRMGGRIVGTISRNFGITVTSVRFVPPGSLPVTTSGKLRRDMHGESSLTPTIWSFERG